MVESNSWDEALERTRKISFSHNLKVIGDMQGNANDVKTIKSLFSKHWIIKNEFKPGEELLNFILGTEEKKSFAVELYLGSIDDNVKMHCIELIIWSHYIRSLRSYRYLSIHPKYDEFACHWLWAQSDGWAEIVEKRIITKLVKSKYPTPKNPRIPKGSLYWT